MFEVVLRTRKGQSQKVAEEVVISAVTFDEANGLAYGLYAKRLEELKEAHPRRWFYVQHSEPWANGTYAFWANGRHGYWSRQYAVKSPGVPLPPTN